MAKKAYEDGFYEVSTACLRGFVKNFPALPGERARLIMARTIFIRPLSRSIENTGCVADRSKASKLRTGLFLDSGGVF
jgi:hypothetical protein